MAELQSFDGNVQYQVQALPSGFNPVVYPTNNPEVAQLARFSETLAGVIQNQVDDYKEQEKAYGLEQAYLNGLPTDQVDEYETQRSQLLDANAKLTEATQTSLKEGVPYEVATKFEKLSGWAKVGYVEGLAQQAGSAYGSWMAQQLEPYQSSNPAEFAAKRAELRQQYITQNGLANLNPALVSKWTFPAFREADGKLTENNRLQYAIVDSQNKWEVLQEGLLAKSIPFQDALNSMSTMVDERGNVIGYKGAWDKWEKLVLNAADAGEDVTELITSAEQSINPITGKQYGESNIRIRLLKEKVAAANRENYAAAEQDENIQFDEEVNGFLEQAGTTPPTDYEVQQFNKYLFDKYQRTSDKIGNLLTTFSQGAIDKKAQEDNFQNLSKLGLLTTEMVTKAGPEFSKWLTIAKAQEEAGKVTGKFKTELKAIENAVNNTVKPSPDGTTSPMATLVIGELQAKFQRKVAEYVGAGMTGPQAAKQALAETFAEFRPTDPNSRYGLSSTGEFSNFEKSFMQGTGQTSKDINSKMNKARMYLQSKNGGKASLNSIPGLIFNAVELKAIEKGYGEPGWSIPPQAQYWANQLNISPLEIINRQREAAGMKPLDTPRVIQQNQQLIRPEFQYLFNRYPSPQRSLRGMSSFKAFVPGLVPKGYGEAVQRAARANGLDPALLAGLLETESSWDKDARSSAGAQGIAQIVPKYHPGVNTADPIASINYAAKLLAGYRKQFGSLNDAIYAYNGGPGGIRKSKENRDYLPKVLAAAAKYGYGQAWTDPATMRPGVVSSITFDSGQPGIDAYFEDKKFRSVLPGRVKEIGNQTTAGGNGYGNYIVVESTDPQTGQPVDVLYAHLDSIGVKEGQRINVNSILGRQGGTGRVVSQDGTIASIDFLAPAPKGSKSMAPYSNYQQLRQYVAQQLRKG